MAGYRRQLYRDDAVVLRVQKLGESDRIITLFTRRHGRLRAVARGVRRTTSRFGARLEPFGHVDLQLAGDPKGNQGSSLHTVSQVEAIELYGKRFLGDYPRYTAASAIAETAERLTPVEREPSLRLFQLTLGAMKSLARGEHATTLVLDAYLLRGMAFAGWAPALVACAVCGEPGRHRAFSVPAGGAVCPDCRPPGAAHPAPATLELMSALTSGDWGYADAAETGVRRECSGLVAAHLQWHLERALRSLPLVDRGAPAAGAVPSPPGGAGPDVVPPRSGAGPVAGVNREMTE
ncbi:MULTISPECIES: DNA repair protein RecO [Micromonospora]|uniref:DNA repair protein RecO n=2 Tax=Micromonospora aurantiaca (nom. illeg.) TaxID=47850 RepID=A0ABQ6UMG0_9ACTN|nr:MULTISPECIES: DNA repair protein RecO [Micromonospora]KAB1118394.1 DNA repair protein RecO [Micromonospora aurantiaca]RNI01901.1 DNA repair protein RecO [Micromonospora aurantiaca]UFN93362.1 DNA repair protein RecO [Micromonospora aurantiaca]